MKVEKSEELYRIIDLCLALQKGGDPFQIDVKKSLETLKSLLPGWKALDELLVDMEALSNISSIISLQHKWLLHRASALHVDPIFVELKIRTSEPEELAEALLESWHPIVTLEQISAHRLREGMDYWMSLMSLDKRYTYDLPSSGETKQGVTVKELAQLRALTQEEFDSQLAQLLAELQSRGRVDYWKFISSKSFAETVERAYLVAFLVSQGLAVLHIRLIDDEAYLEPYPPTSSHSLPRSVSVPLTYERWLKAKAEEKN